MVGTKDFDFVFFAKVFGKMIFLFLPKKNLDESTNLSRKLNFFSTTVATGVAELHHFYAAPAPAPSKKF
jgi:hypothetical protein